MSEKLARSAGVIGIAVLGSRILGLLRNTAIAYFFGAGATVDAFQVATRMPALLRELFAEGAMSAAFVPTFTRTLAKGGKPAAWRLGSQVINALLVVTAVLVVLGIVFAEPLVRFYVADEFEADAVKFPLTVSLTRWTLPFLTFVAIAAAFMGMLNALRRFFVPAFSPAMLNVVMIASAAVSGTVCPMVGVDPIFGLAFGFMLGGAAQMLVQLPSLRAEGFRHEWVLDRRDPGVREVMMLMGPGTIGQAAAQINILVNTVIATNLGTGAVSWLNFAFQLMYMPIGLFGVSIATASVPDLATHAAAGDHAGMRRTLSSGMRLMLSLAVPSCVGLMVLAGPIIELTLEYGKFTSADAVAVASAVMLYAPGLIGYSMVKMLTPSFYSLQDARTPLIVSAITVASNLAMNLTFVQWLDFRGLALGTGIAANINAGLLMILLSRRIGGVDALRIGTTFIKVLLASLAMGVAAYYTEAWVHARMPAEPFDSLAMTVLIRGVRVVSGIGVGMAVLALASALLRIEEFQQAVARVLRRVRK